MLRIVRLAVGTVFGAMVAVTVPVSSLSVTSGGWASASQSATDDFTWQGRVAPGLTLEIKNINGSIRAQLAAGDQVDVVARKTGTRSNPADVRIEVVEHAGGVTICAVYPSPDGTPNECAPGKGGRNRVQNNDVKVDFELRVPASVALAARSVNGGIDAKGLHARVSAHTVNGSVAVATQGLVDADTVNGSIDASLGAAEWEGTLEFKTVNGGITVTLPAGVSARVLAETVNGDLQTDFPLTIQGRFGPRKLEGTIGQGGRDLHLKTVNGRIAVRKAG